MSMPESPGVTNDEGRIENAAGSIRDMTKDMVEAVPAQGRGLPMSCARRRLRRLFSRSQSRSCWVC